MAEQGGSKKAGAGAKPEPAQPPAAQPPAAQPAAARQGAKAAPPTVDAAFAAFQRGALTEALTLCRLLLTEKPDDSSLLQLAGIVLYHQGKLSEAEAMLKQAIAAAPTVAELHANLGAVLRAAKRPAEAEAAHRRATMLKPDFAEAHNNLGNALRELGRLADAAASFTRAAQLKPEFYDAQLNLGRVLHLLGKLPDAEAALRRAIALRPQEGDGYNDLGNALLGMFRLEEAEEAFRTAVKMKPQAHEPALNLTALLLRAGRPTEAEQQARRVLQMKPDLFQAYNNLAVALEDQARLPEAADAFRKALGLKADYATGLSSLLFCLNYHPTMSAEDIFAEYKKWDERHGKPNLPREVKHENSRDTARRLKVGYVSPDFRHHAVAMFFEPVLAAHDKKRVEIFLYGEVANPDATTARLQSMAEHYRSTVGLSDDEVAKQIRTDGIDVLVDLAGHTSGNRLAAFARKPAPVQMSYLIGHGYTTGLSAIDGFIADAAMAPPGSEHLFSERLLRLGRSPLVYQPPAGMPEVGPLPAAKNGYVTFGSFSRTVRLNEKVIQLWSELLKRVPKSRLVLNSKPFAEEATKKLFLDRFAKNGIGPERLDLIYTQPQPKTWAKYNDIDIALDPFPHNAGTTTIEALWMGVPVISLAARPAVGRFGASILGAVGLDDWVAKKPEEYVVLGMKWARDLKGLAMLRAGLRKKFEASPMRDAKSLARAIEDGYFNFFKDWAKRNPEADKPAEPEIQYSDVVAAFNAGDRAKAQQLCEQLLTRQPNHADALQAMGVICCQNGDYQTAMKWMSRAVAQNPNSPEYWSTLGVAARALKLFPDAEKFYRRALGLRPEFAEAHNNLGNTLRDQGKYKEAEQTLKEAVRLNPKFEDALLNLGLVLLAQERYIDAEPVLKQAYDLNQNRPEVQDAMALMYTRRGMLFEAEKYCLSALKLRPDHVATHGTYGIVLQDMGRHAEATEILRRAVALSPTDLTVSSNLLFCLNYRPDLTGEEIFAEYRRWDDRHGRPHLPRPLHHANTPDPLRKIRIGYVSPDFRHHVVSLFFEPILAQHDRSRFEIYLYGEVANPDFVTKRFQRLADHWRSTVTKSDDEVAAQIREDGIDILVDLAGHTSGNRLAVFARKPAPVQMSYLIGHGYTTGLSAIDGFIADAAMAPPGSEPLFSERIVRLGRVPLVYQPPSGMPEVGPLPALKNGYVTFGCFSRTVRLNEKVIALWSELLNRVPNSKLVLNSKPFAEDKTRDLYAARFAEHGISEDRLELIYTQPQPKTWAKYNDIDIALDPFPHNAGTTTIEALWMGVPVISLAGRASVGRFGASILGAVGMEDWVTEDADEYVNIGARWAADLDKLGQLRADLRPRFDASPMRDPESLTRAIEDAYAEYWQEWCDRRMVTTEAVAAPASAPSAEATQFADAVRAFQSGRLAEAEAHASALLATDPDHIDALHILGLVAYRRRLWKRAADLIGRAIELKPDFAELRWNRAGALRQMGRLEEAESELRKAVELAPESAEAWNNLGNTLKDRSKLYESESAFRNAVRLRPEYLHAWMNLGNTLFGLGRFVEAEAVCRKALEIDPQSAESTNNLGNALLGQERLSEAETCFRRAIELKPDYVLANSNLLFCLNYHASMSAEDIFAEYRNWDERHGKPHLPKELTFENDRNGARRLKVGYVSPDFRHHAVAMFFEPVLAAHDKKYVEVYLYGEVANPDATTTRLQGLADHYRSTVGLSDEEVAAQIRWDGIDVLVDLAGHTSGNRLTVFARKPAPVQMSYLIGHGYTTGLGAIDGFIADAAMAPPGSEHLFSEKIVRLGRSPLVYQPPAGMPEVGPLPALKNGYVTFGCFSRTVRLNEKVIQIWSELLKRVPDARLVLNSKPFAEDASKQLFLERFAKHGIAADRLELVYTQPQPKTWAKYNDIDIALDPFPHNAGTTTIEALWMGVPVISLAGRPSVGRFGASIMGAVGLDEWVTESPEEYVNIGARWTADLEKLGQLRADLRPRFDACPMRDPYSLTEAMEAAYRAFFAEWAAKAKAG